MTAFFILLLPLRLVFFVAVVCFFSFTNILR